MLLLVADPLISSFTLILLGLPIILFYLFYRKILTKRGKIGQELMGKKFKTIKNTFMCVGGMGHSISIASGLALAKKKIKFYV